MPGKGGLQLTGKLGEVIRESAQIALSWTKAHAHALGVTEDPSVMILNDRDVHVHMPEGSIGKEGPSAGTAILSAFVSLFTKTKIHPDIGTSPWLKTSFVASQLICVSYDWRNFSRGTGSPRWRPEGEDFGCSSCGYQDDPRTCC